MTSTPEKSRGVESFCVRSASFDFSTHLDRLTIPFQSPPNSFQTRGRFVDRSVRFRGLVTCLNIGESQALSHLREFSAQVYRAHCALRPRRRGSARMELVR
jgi:hypothetical protein